MKLRRFLPNKHYGCTDGRVGSQVDSRCVEIQVTHLERVGGCDMIHYRLVKPNGIVPNFVTDKFRGSISNDFCAKLEVQFRVVDFRKEYISVFWHNMWISSLDLINC